MAAEPPPKPPAVPSDAGIKVDPLARFADPLASPARTAFDGGKFAMRPGEVVAFIGPANMVFEQQQGWFESLLASGFREQRPVFRHMSWEGDTVYEQSRAMNFGGWNEQFEAVGVSTIVTWFGQLEALDDSKDVAEFTAAYGRLLDKFAGTTPRLVVIAPPPFEKPAETWVRDNTPRNLRVAAHAEAARRLAAEHGAVFVDLYTQLTRRSGAEPRLTVDGLHFSAEGQRIVGERDARRPDGRDDERRDSGPGPLSQRTGAHHTVQLICRQ